MGSNRRYAKHYDRLMDERILEGITESGPLGSLTDEELELDRLPLTVDPQPEPVRAWVHFGATSVHVVGLALRWTPRAIGIQFEVRGKQWRTWVWASAVERAAAKPEEAPGRHP